MNREALAREEIERLALVLLNEDRIAAGCLPLESRDDVPDSDGYVRNVHALLDALNTRSDLSALKAKADALAEAAREAAMALETMAEESDSLWLRTVGQRALNQLSTALASYRENSDG